MSQTKTLLPGIEQVKKGQKPSSEQRSITILGSTGSVGTQTVDLLRADLGQPEHSRKFRVQALVGGRNATLLAAQAIELGAERAVISDPAQEPALRAAVSSPSVTATPAAMLRKARRPKASG